MIARHVQARKLSVAVVLETLEQRRLLSATPANVQVTTNADVQQQPSIVADPANPKHLVIAYMDRSLVTTGYAGIRVSVSEDGGKSWTQSPIPLPAGFDGSAANPIAKYDDRGHLFVSFMATTFLGPKPPYNNPSGSDPVTHDSYTIAGFTANNGIFVARSDDGGLSWDTPTAVTANLYDGHTQVPFDRIPDMAIDTSSSSPYDGNIYLIWSRYYPLGGFPGEPDSTGGSQMQIAVSSDAGKTFQLRPHINDVYDSGTGPPLGFGAANWGHLAVGPQGFLYAAFFDNSDFAVLHSEDAGATFDADSSEDHANQKHTVFGDLASLGSTDDSQAGGPLAKLPGFRTQVTRSIVADPVHPGRLYASESVGVYDKLGTETDADIFFARSDDNSLTWTTLQVGGKNGAVNDDNFGQLFTGQDSDVHARQFFARLAGDDSGRIVAEWYDTRRDSGGMKLDVFGAISTDGGKSFGPNFHITEKPFDVSAGKFTNALGNDSYYLGDFIGLNISGDTAYTAWTDTRNGNQDIYFSSFAVSNPPAPENDRLEPNDTASSAANLGPIIDALIPKLHMGPGDSDWFDVQTPATGTLDVHVLQSRQGNRLQLDLFDETGTILLASSKPLRDSTGRITGQSLTMNSKAGEKFALRVRPFVQPSGGEASTLYSLQIKALTADLRTIAHDALHGTLAAGDQNYFLFSAAASGLMRLKLSTDSANARFKLEILDPKTMEPLSTGSLTGTASLAVDEGRTLLARISGKSDAAAGAYALNLTNLDSFASASLAPLFVPSGPGPSTIVSADLDGDGADDLVIGDGYSNTVSVLMSNRDGTFQAPRQFAVGPFEVGILGPLIPTFRRDLLLADFNGDGKLDLAVCNPSAGDVSILLGRGDGTFEPERRFDAVSLPFGISSGDLNHDGNADLAVINVSAGKLELAVLLGRGDGTFQSPVFIPTGIKGSGVGSVSSDVRIVDINGDGNADLLYTGALDLKTYVLLGNGDGKTFSKITTHTGKRVRADGGGPTFVLADLNNDGNLDLVNFNLFDNDVSYAFGDGSGRFANAITFDGGTSPVSGAVADVASLDADGELGPPDGIPDIITVASGYPQTSFTGPGEITVSPGEKADDGTISYDDGVPLASAIQPLDVVLGDFLGDGNKETAFTDTDGVRVAFNQQIQIPDNATRDTARDLGTVVHLLEPTLTIVPAHADAWYTLMVPTEAAHGSGDEVIDFAAFFEHQRGGGLDMQVLDDAGNVLGSGGHVRIAARQGEKLAVHVLGLASSDNSRGSGAYTLDIDVLPQVVSVAAQTLLPSGEVDHAGGPTNSLVITFQGDRLYHDDAETADVYHAVWLGPDGIYGTSDDQSFIPSSGQADTKAVVYNPSANLDISTGRTYPTAVRQTVTLNFPTPLPAGSYRINLTEIGSDPLGAAQPSFDPANHPLVTRDAAGQITIGASIIAKDLVAPTGTLGKLGVFRDGTAFLSQLHDDLGALLDQALTSEPDPSVLTHGLLQQMLLRVQPSLAGATSMLALFLDPVSLDLQDPSGSRVNYDLESGNLGNQISDAFVSVAGNVELVVIPMTDGQYTLNVDDVPATARGGAIILNGNSVQTVSLTDEMRGKQRTFVLEKGESLSPPSKSADSIDRTPDVLPPAETTSAVPASSINPQPLLNSADLHRTTGPSAAASSVGTAVGAAPIRAEPLGGGDTTMTPPTIQQPAAILRMFAEQIRLFLSQLLGTADAPQTTAPAGDEPKKAATPAASATEMVEPVFELAIPIDVQPRSSASDVPLIQDCHPTSGNEARDAVSLLAAAPFLVTRAMELHTRRGRRGRRRSLNRR